MLLGTSLTKEIDYKLYRYVTLIDPALNQFEVAVDKSRGTLCFTHGIEELHKAYNLENGACITLISVRCNYLL